MLKEQAAVKGNAFQENRTELEPELLSIMKEEVGKARDKNIPIIRAFEAIAKRSGLKANTIRNYYYRYLYVQDRSRKDSSENKLDSSDMIGSPFTEEETRELMRTMLIAQARGESVRGCANRLAKGNKRVLIRLQNKYRSIIAREPEYVEALIKELESEGIECHNPYSNKPAIRSSYQRLSKTDRENENLIDLLSQIMSNMNKIENVNLYGFFKGLRDLSALASEKSADSIALKQAEDKIRELNNRLLIAEASSEKARKEAGVLGASLRNLLNINSRFIELTDSEKITGLNTYIRELKSYMER